jgi:hypothetical protein
MVSSLTQILIFVKPQLKVNPNYMLFENNQSRTIPSFFYRGILLVKVLNILYDALPTP